MNNSALRAVLQRGKEYIPDIVYDSCLFTSSSANPQSLFTVNIGGTGNGITGKNYFHTNMEQVGKLANKERFVVYGMSIWLEPNSAATLGFHDTNASDNIAHIGYLTTGYASVKIQNKTYREFPISYLTQFRCQPISGVASRCVYAIQSPLCADTGFFRLSAPMVFGVDEQFGVDLKLETLPPAISQVENYFLLFFGFWGLRERAIQ